MIVKEEKEEDIEARKEKEEQEIERLTRLLEQEDLNWEEKRKCEIELAEAKRKKGIMEEED